MEPDASLDVLPPCDDAPVGYYHIFGLETGLRLVYKTLGLMAAAVSSAEVVVTWGDRLLFRTS